MRANGPEGLLRHSVVIMIKPEKPVQDLQQVVYGRHTGSECNQCIYLVLPVGHPVGIQFQFAYPACLIGDVPLVFQLFAVAALFLQVSPAGACKLQVFAMLLGKAIFDQKISQ